jgi:nucleoside-diphosphate-sugar epimerase
VKEPTIIVTGATGFVGCHLIRQLLNQGGKKIVASTHSGSKKNLEDIAGKLTFARADIGNFSNVLRMVEQHKPATI